MAKAKTEKLPSPSPQTVFNEPLTDLEAKVERVLTDIEAAMASLTGLTPLDVAGRQKTSGKLKLGEEVALLAIAKVMEYRPAAFMGLANKDHGDDPEAVETLPMQEGLERIKLLARLVVRLKDLVTLLADTILVLGAQVKDVATAAYPIAKGIALSDAIARGLLAPATDFYGALGRKGARTKAAKQVVRKD